MSRINTLKTVASTVLFAAAVGFIVQYGETAPAMASAEANPVYNKAPRTLMMSKNAQGVAVFGMPDVVTIPFDHSAHTRQVLAVDVVYTELDVPKMGPIMATPVIGCETSLSAKRQPAALVELTVTAPCFEDSDFSIRHEGLVFSAKTERNGDALVVVPALMASAEFAVAFDNIVQATTDIFVPELRQYDRAVLQWAGVDNIRIHALEDGAEIGDPGHVWSASLHQPKDIREGQHGFVLYLGTAEDDASLQAEVYTFPAGKMNQEGEVDLRVGVSVTEANCGREVDATTIQTNADLPLIKSNIAIQMPDCSQVGEVVLLGGKFADVAVVSN